MLAQLPRHTVAKKVENYEHLDLLWGKDVDKVVFPHVLEFLKTYAPVEKSKAQKAESSRHQQEESTGPPAYSTSGLRKRGNADHSQRESGVSYAQVAASGGDLGQRGEEFSYAKVTSESPDPDESDESDSDETMGEDPSIIEPGISFAEAAKSNTQDNKNKSPAIVESGSKGGSSPVPGDSVPGIDKPVTSEISYADMAAK